LTAANTKKNDGYKRVKITSRVKRMDKKRPGDPSEGFMVGKGAKWSNADAVLNWEREVPAREQGGKVTWRSPKFMSKAGKPKSRSKLHVRGILKRVCALGVRLM
jgi:hypothetical protein